MAAVIVEVMLLTGGCACLFPSNQSTTLCRWKSWSEVNAAFDQIAPDHTTIRDLQIMGFDPSVTPNIKIIPLADILQLFLPNASVRVSDLPEGVREYIESRKNNPAYLVELQDIRDKRHGDIILDIFSFKRQTHQSGWRFKGLILMTNDVVVYRLSSGEPQVASEDKKIKPLGPFQELDGSVLGWCRGAF